MNKLQKDIVFYSNYCLHCNNLLNKISKTILHDKILYVCIDDKNIKIPRIITRVPSLYIVGEKKVLIENEIDIWVRNQVSAFENKNKQMNLQMPISQSSPSMDNHPSQDHGLPTINATPQMPDGQMPNGGEVSNMPVPDRQMPNSGQMPNQNTSNNTSEGAPDGDILAYHGNEMGSTLSNNYSFLEETDNSSLNHNFTFIGDNGTNSINTPKEFNDNNQVKSELDQQYEKLMEARNSDPTSKGIQRI
jgi:hypothetical protein